MPATVPAPQLVPNPNLNAYERTTQALIFNQVAANQAQAGTAAPVNAKIYGMVGTLSRGQLPYTITLQIDVGGTGNINTGLVVTLLGSLDGTNFYSLGTVTLGATPLGFIQTFSGISARYLTASIGGYGIASGAPTVTVSISA